MSVARARLQRNFSDAAASYDARAGFQHTQTRRVLDAARMLTPPTARLADIGCGTGYFAALARPIRPDWRVFGADIAPGMCAAAAERCPAVQADAVQLPWAGSAFDTVVSSLCLQWVDDLARAFAEIHRVLKPGGRAIFTSLAPGTLQELRDAAQHATLPLGLLAMRDAGIYRAAIAAAGLEIDLLQQHGVLEHYPHIFALLDSMRAIGAGNHLRASNSGLTGAGRWKKMLRVYETLRTPQGIPARWEVLFMVVDKPA